MLSLIIKDIYQCEDTDHVYVIFRTSQRATHIVRAGDLVPANTMLVTPALSHFAFAFFPSSFFLRLFVLRHNCEVLQQIFVTSTTSN